MHGTCIKHVLSEASIAISLNYTAHNAGTILYMYEDYECVMVWVPNFCTTSDFSVKTPSLRLSTAIHLTGNLTALSAPCLK